MRKFPDGVLRHALEATAGIIRWRTVRCRYHGGKSTGAKNPLVASGGVISHVGLQDNEAGLDTRRLTLDEITFLGNYTYSVIYLRVAIDLLFSGALGSLYWI